MVGGWGEGWCHNLVWDWPMCKPKKDNSEASRAAGFQPCTPLGMDSWSFSFCSLFSIWGHDVILMLMYTVTKATHFIPF